MVNKKMEAENIMTESNTQFSERSFVSELSSSFTEDVEMGRVSMVETSSVNMNEHLMIRTTNFTKIYTLISTYFKKNQLSVKKIVFPSILILVVFVIAFVIKSKDTTKSLLPSGQCETCPNCGSFSLNKQTLNDGVDFLLMVPEVNSPSGYNYSTGSIYGSWESCSIPPQSDSFDLDPVPSEKFHNAINSSSFVIPSSSNNSFSSIYEIDPVEVTKVRFWISAGGYNTPDCFQLLCYTSFVPGMYESPDHISYAKIYGVNFDMQLIGQISITGASVTGSCYGSVGGQLATALTVANTVTVSDIIVCIEYPGTFTVLSIALSYALTTFSVLKCLLYIYDSTMVKL
jgi:hypothetical protein